MYFLISSLILIIPSALPILLILLITVFPSFWKSGATLSVSTPLATMIAVMISVASIRTSSVTSPSFSVYIASSPSRMSSPSSTKVVTSFSAIHDQSAILMFLLFKGHLFDKVILPNIRLYSLFSHLTFRNSSSSSMLLWGVSGLSIPLDPSQ